MTIAGWIATGLMILITALFSIVGACEQDSYIPIVIGVIVAICIVAGMLFYFNNTASGKRAMIDQRSELENGIERTVTVYTANGDEIAHYEGKIDIEANNGGYVKFDFDGKRYIYYNCFVETIAEID